MSQVFNTRWIEVYNVAMKASTPDREAEWLPGWELPILSCRIFIFASTGTAPSRGSDWCLQALEAWLTYLTLKW